MRELEADTWTIRSAAGAVRALGLDIEAAALETAPALLTAARSLEGAAVAEALGAAAPAVSGVLEDLTTALTALGTGLYRAAQEYEVAESAQVSRFTTPPAGR